MNCNRLKPGRRIPSIKFRNMVLILTPSGLDMNVLGISQPESFFSPTAVTDSVSLWILTDSLREGRIDNQTQYCHEPLWLRNTIQHNERPLI